jgi:hypothetical protein
MITFEDGDAHPIAKRELKATAPLTLLQCCFLLLLLVLLKHLGLYAARETRQRKCSVLLKNRSHCVVSCG